jgi:hypothetical protein
MDELLLKTALGTLLGTRIEFPKGYNKAASGHASGDFFEKKVYSILREAMPHKVFRQYELLNDLYSKNLKTIKEADKSLLFKSPTAHFLLSRGDSASKGWSLDNLFQEKQNDTADVVIVEDSTFNIIDIKTRSLSKKGQPPNIVSSFKIAQMCGYLLDNEDFGSLNIFYVAIDWLHDGQCQVCENFEILNLFKIPPTKENLYINWAAALQIQFHATEVEQTYNKDKRSWCLDYLNYYVSSAKARISHMESKFIEPFEKYLKLYG